MSSAIPPLVLPTIETPDEPDDYRYDSSSRLAYRQNNSRSALTVPVASHDHDRDHNHYPFYDPKRLSPVAPTFPSHNTLLVPEMASNTDGDFSNENSAPIDIPKSNAPNPFNFQTQVISTSPVKPNVGQRRGHKYKHSSISAQHQIFQEPPPRPPLALPRDLPVPTLNETWKSMSKDQRHRLYCNFEVWKRSSIRYPFGLERAEVLAGFAMSIFLIFGGFDLVSHNVKHVLEGHGGHDHNGGHAHEHDEPRVAMGSVDFVSLAAIVATLISAFGLRNHARISRAMRVSYLASLPSILSNPFHFLTLSVSALLVMLPLFSIHLHIMLDSVVCGLIAIAMFGLGTRLAIAQGLMLLMSYGGRAGSSASGRYKEFGVSDVLREIETESSIERVEEAQFWQVHYGLCMANLKLSVARGCDDATLSRMRLRVSNLIQNRLGEGYGRGGSLKWEVSLQMGTST
ncbi:hypothetical protein CHU98_g700 [Xylaria longipes]|nr:hypothetical protein CHU98_g700 [Xylaria longipes]